MTDGTDGWSVIPPLEMPLTYTPVESPAWSWTSLSKVFQAAEIPSG
jgi:hypothetical protein